MFYMMNILTRTICYTEKAQNKRKKRTVKSENPQNKIDEKYSLQL